MSKSDAATALWCILGGVLFGGWYAGMFYGLGHRESKFTDYFILAHLALACVIVLGIVGFAIYCVYILIA